MSRFDSEFEMPELGLRVGGRAKKALSTGLPVDLDEDDLRRLAEPRESTAEPIKKLRERHHALARMLATGMAPGEAAIACGYSSSRVSILQGDPTFRELVSHYADLRTERYFDGLQVMAELHMDAVEEIRDRLENEPEEFTIGQLMELTKLTADRTGKGPTTKTEVDVKVGLADRLQAGYARALAARGMRDVTPKGDKS
jgi:hypothetical protein